MKIKDFLVGKNAKSINPEIEKSIVEAAKENKISVRSILEAKEIVVVYYNFGDEVESGFIKEKNDIFKKLNPIVLDILADHDYEIKQSLRSNYDTDIGSIIYFLEQSTK